MTDNLLGVNISAPYYPLSVEWKYSNEKGTLLPKIGLHAITDGRDGEAIVPTPVQDVVFPSFNIPKFDFNLKFPPIIQWVLKPCNIATYPSNCSLTWTEHDLSSSFAEWVFAWSPTLALFVGVRGAQVDWADDEFNIITSSDGYDWTVRPVIDADPDTNYNYFDAVAWFQGGGGSSAKFIAFGYELLLPGPTIERTKKVSYNGIDWVQESSNSPSSAQFRKCINVSGFIDYDSGGFNINLIAIGQLSGQIMASENGSFWQGYWASDPLEDAVMLDIAFSPELSLVVIVGYVGSTYYTWTSSDGYTWTKHSNPFGIYNPRSIAWSSDLGVFVVGANGAMFVSSDGFDYATTFIISGTCTSIVWANSLSKFIAIEVLVTSTAYLESSDGYNWVICEEKEPLVVDLCWADTISRALASGYNGKVMVGNLI